MTIDVLVRRVNNDDKEEFKNDCCCNFIYHFHLVHYVLGVVDEDELMFLHDVYIKKKK